MSKKRAYAAMAVGVEALEDAGLEVEEADVKEVVEGNELGAIFGGEPDASHRILFIVDPTETAEQDQEIDDEDPKDGDGIKIEFDSEKTVEEEAQ